jgi:hypothetical protein
MTKKARFSLPTRSTGELARQADLYRRLAAAMSDKTKSQNLLRLARRYEAMAEAEAD